MRIHKYKAWHKEEKVMCNVSNISFLDGISTLLDQINYSVYNCHYDEIELLEYSGCIDRDGKEIFEGDNVEKLIVGVTSKPYFIEGTVFFENGEWLIDAGASVYPLCIDRELYELKVLGNKFEGDEK